MEDKKVAYNALGSAGRWLNSGRINSNGGNYDAALYSLEMAVEISLKAVLLSLNFDAPKTHAIGDFVKEAVRGNGKVPEEFRSSLPETLSVFNALLELRSVSGYIFESEKELKELGKMYSELRPKAEEAVKKCNNAVNAIIGPKKK